MENNIELKREEQLHEDAVEKILTKVEKQVRDYEERNIAAHGQLFSVQDIHEAEETDLVETVSLIFSHLNNFLLEVQRRGLILKIEPCISDTPNSKSIRDASVSVKNPMSLEISIIKRIL